jgi:hypothetical protein
MARYEGMDEIVQRLQARMTEGSFPPDRPQPDMTRHSNEQSDENQYAVAVEKVMLIRRDAHELRALLGSDNIRVLNHLEQEDLLSLLTRVQQELSSCEAALRGMAPHE